MDEEDRIRRAEEIAARRNNRIPANNINNGKKIKLSRLAKISIQTLSSIIIFGICYFLYQNHSYAIEMIKPAISNDTDFVKLYNDISYAIKNIKDDTNNIDKNIEETNNEQENNIEQNILKENINEGIENNGVGGGDDNTKVSESEDDVSYIKKNASFIKPLEGIITSKYGPRTPTDVISANHAGVDIGASVGTTIVASMAGKAELVSSEGDYGNHIKITKGEISTLYAHCSEILVKQGEEIKQGQIIAKVGSTGKATGPHLHFEIRRNNVTVNPQEILDLE